MNSKFRRYLLEQLPFTASDTLFEIELFYLIRECINRVDPARIADVGQNAMQTGVSEYESETFAVLGEVQAHYLQEELLTKTELRDFLSALFVTQFYPGIFKPGKAETLAQSIYNELYKLELGKKAKATSPYAHRLTNCEEYSRYLG